MTKNDIQQLYEFNRWANGRILKAVSALTPNQFNRDLGGSFRSVRDTLVHIMGAEWIWLMRWKGTSPKSLLDPGQCPTLDNVRKKWAEIEQEQSDFVSRVSEESLSKILAYVNTQGESWQYPLVNTMQHLVNHSSYHRGQITLMLRQLGAEPLATDFLVFFDVGRKE